jgi:cation diffusion facilitator family transporter
MVTFLRRLFIRNYQNTQDEKVRVEHGKLAAWFGIFSNLLLVAMKIAVAFILAVQAFNAQTDTSFTVMDLLPMALVADAVNNLSDMASSIVTLVGFKISGKPADKEHPFGHERIEYIAGLIVSVIVIVLAVELFRDSITKIVEKQEVQYELVTILVLAAAVLVKLLQGFFNFGMGKAIDSEALKATSLDSLTDAIATAAIMVSGVFSYTLHANYLDGYMSLVVSLFVFYSGVKMVKSTADPLIGEATDKEFVQKIVKDVLAHKEIKGVHDVICHSYGPTKYFISLHAEIDQNMPMLDAHDIIDNIEEEIRHKHHCDITIHMDPIAIGDPETERMKKEVTAYMAGLAHGNLHFHDFRIVKGSTHTNVIFDVVLPYNEDITEQQFMDGLVAYFKNEKMVYHFVVHFDRSFTE